MEKLTVFNDFANINAAYQQQGMSPDYRDLLHYLSEGRFLVEAHAFVPIDPRSPHARDQVIEDLCGQGYLVHTKIGALAGDGYRCDFDVEITLELMRTAEIVKPDIIVLELALEGEMAAKDVINLIKATMEWVDIPLILWTRETVTNQREARQIHGADELVEKSAGAAALVARVITVFRRS